MMATARRIPGIDYSAPGCYFVTIVTAARRPRLGAVGPDGMRPTPIGKLVVEAWNHTGHRRPWVSTPAYCLMPDHCHGLVAWERRPDRPSQTISVIVNGFKAEATRLARRARLLRSDEMLWQRSFDVRLLVSDASIERAARYIEENPRRAWVRLTQRSPRPDGRG